MANYLLEKHGVNLLLVHLINPDGVEHNYGPHTPEAYQAVAESDQRIAEIWATLQKPPLAGIVDAVRRLRSRLCPLREVHPPQRGAQGAGPGDRRTTRTRSPIARPGASPKGARPSCTCWMKSRRSELTAQLKQKLAALEGVDGGRRARRITAGWACPRRMPIPNRRTWCC